MNSRKLIISDSIFFRYEVQSIGDVLDHLDHGLQHVIQAGIDRANQCARVTAHMICDWRIMPNQFTYEVCIYLPSVRRTTQITKCSEIGKYTFLHI